MSNLIYSVLCVTVFLTDLSVSKVIELNSENADKIIDGKKFVFVFFYASWDEQSNKVLEIYDDVSVAFEGHKDIIIAKANGYEDTKLATRYWIDRFPSFRYFVKGSKTEETYKGGKTSMVLIRFIRSHSQITFDRGIFLRPVIELESSNFERIIKDRTKNVLVFYYNGFCKLCKKMEYTIHHIGQTFSNELDCVVARMDCDINAGVCLDHLIPHYPTIKIYPRNNKDGYRYEPGKKNEFYNETSITRFMNALCKTQRVKQGRLDTQAGRLEEFDKLAESFMKEWERREHILREVQMKSTNHESKEYVDYYAMVMNRVLKEGTHVVSHEIERIERLIAGQVHPNKIDQLEKRKNILKQFHGFYHEKDEL